MRESFEAVQLREKGISPSLQRLGIYRYLRGSKAHPRVEDIYQALSRDIPTLSRTTVYNTLGLLAEKGLARVLRIEDTELRYDAEMVEHLHFKCIVCGMVLDVMDDALPKALDALGHEALAGCVVRERQVYYQGLCRTCAGSGA